jgi:hypothetical protein
MIIELGNVDEVTQSIGEVGMLDEAHYYSSVG